MGGWLSNGYHHHHVSASAVLCSGGGRKEGRKVPPTILLSFFLSPLFLTHGKAEGRRGLLEERGEREEEEVGRGKEPPLQVLFHSSARLPSLLLFLLSFTSPSLPISRIELGPVTQRGERREREGGGSGGGPTPASCHALFPSTFITDRLLASI